MQTSELMWVNWKDLQLHWLILYSASVIKSNLNFETGMLVFAALYCQEVHMCIRNDEDEPENYKMVRLIE